MRNLRKSPPRSWSCQEPPESASKAQGPVSCRPPNNTLHRGEVTRLYLESSESRLPARAHRPRKEEGPGRRWLLLPKDKETSALGGRGLGGRAWFLLWGRGAMGFCGSLKQTKAEQHTVGGEGTGEGGVVRTPPLNHVAPGPHIVSFLCYPAITNPLPILFPLHLPQMTT